MDRAAKELLFTAFGAVMIIVIALGIGEVVTRIYHGMHERERFIWIPDPYLGVVHAPNNEFLYGKSATEEFDARHKTNALGLLGGKVEIPKPVGITRVLVLGDSFTEALQVSSEEKFPMLVQRFLNIEEDGRGGTFEVVNAGISGYSPVSEYLYLRRELLKLKPDVIIVQLFADDVFEDHKITAMSLLDAEGLPVRISRYFREEFRAYSTLEFERTRHRSLPRKFHDWAVRHSRFLEYMHVKSFERRKNSGLNKEMSEKLKYDERERFFAVQEDSPLYQDGTLLGAAWRMTRKYLKAIKGLADAQRARLVLLYIPPPSQLGLTDGEDMPPESKDSTNELFNDFLGTFAGQNNIDYLDMLPVFKLYKDEELYFAEDGHLTTTGHRLVAGELFDLLAGDTGSD